MKLAVVGSRTVTNYEVVKQVLDGFEGVTEVISGGAAGADSLGARWATEKGLKLTVFRPDWKRYGRAAGMIRNKNIIDTADEVVAFWDGQSKGTANSIERARKAGKPLTIVDIF